MHDMIKSHLRLLGFKHLNSIGNLGMSLNSFEKIKILNYPSIFYQSKFFDKFQFVGMTLKMKFKEQSFTLFAYTNYRIIQGYHRLETLDFKGKSAFHHFLVQ